MVRIEDSWVVFSFYRPQAEQVHIAGDFNDWREGDLPMRRTEDGYWMARMRLPAGEFRFRYHADGQWFTDYAAFGVEPGRFGLDSILRVVTPPVRIADSLPVEPAVAAA